MQSKNEFIAIIRDHEGLIYKVAKVYTDDKDDEKDLYQEIVYQLWKSFDSFKNEAKISTWMYRVALNTAITQLKKEKRKGEHVPINDQVLNRAEVTDVSNGERIERLYAQIRKLNTIEKAIILLYLEGKSYEEIAGLTGFTSSNVGTRLNRIRQKIITQLN